MSDGQIVVSGLTKVYKNVRAVDDLSFTVRARPGHRLPRARTAPARPPRCGWCSTWSGRPPAPRPSAAGATPTCTTRSARSAPSSRRPAPTAAGRAATTCGCCATRPASRSAGPTTCSTMVDLTAAADRKFKGYSLGMRQRLGIAAALLGDPEVLILDEPANGLDPEGIRWMRDLLKALADQGRTVLVSSHLLSEMEILADDLVIIAAGKLVRQGTVSRDHRLDGHHPDAGTHAEAGRSCSPRSAPRSRATRTADGALLLTGADGPTIGDAALRAGAADPRADRRPTRPGERLPPADRRKGGHPMTHRDRAAGRGPPDRDPARRRARAAPDPQRDPQDLLHQRLVAVRHRVARHHRPVDVGQHGRGGRRHRRSPATPTPPSGSGRAPRPTTSPRPSSGSPSSTTCTPSWSRRPARSSPPASSSGWCWSCCSASWSSPTSSSTRPPPRRS